MTEAIILDLETTVKNKEVGTFKANPHCPDNYVVLGGWKDLLAGGTAFCTTPEPPKGNPVMVGHNIGFDILYLLREDMWKEWFKDGIIWDTMIVEYLLSGQDTKFASLDSLAEKVGGTVKNNKIKEYWDNGVQTEDIPLGDLTEYWMEDLRNTEKVFLDQLNRAEALGMLPLIRTQMESRLATIEAEFNGMYFSEEERSKQESELTAHLVGIITKLAHIFENSFNPDTPRSWINIASNDQVSLVMFGGWQEFTVNKPMMDTAGLPIYWKSGKKKGERRYKKETIKYYVRGLTSQFKEPTKKTGIYKTGEDILKKIVEQGTSIGAAQLAKYILEYRSLQKEYTSFILPYKDKVWKHDSCIHQKYNHCVSATGRISCSDPNLQQIPRAGE